MRLFDNSAIRIDLFPGRKEKRDGKNNKNVTARSNEPRVANARVPQGTKLQKDGPGSSSVKTAKSLQNMDSVASQRPDTTRAYNSYDAEKSGAGYSNNKGASSSYTYQRPSMDRANHDAEPRTSEQKGPWLLQRGESPLVNRVEMSRNKQQAEQRPNATDHGYFAGQSGMNREPNGSSSRQRDEPPAAAHRTEMNRNNHAEQWTTPTGYGNPTGQSTTDVDRSGLSSRQRNDSSPADRPETNRNNHAQQRTTATADGQYSIPSTMRSESERPSRDQRRSRADIQDEIEADQKLRTNIPLGAPHSTGHALKHKRSKADMIRATENMARTLSRSPHRSPANKRQREVADDARPGTSSSNGSYQQTQFSRSNSNTRAPYGVSPTNSHGTARDNSHSRQRSVDTNGQNAYRTQTPDGSKATNGADNASPQYDGLSPTKVSSVAKKQGKAFNSTIRTSPPLPMEPNKTTWSPTSSVARKKSSERQNNGRQKNVSANSAGHQRQYSHSRNHAGTQAGSTLRQPDQSTGPSERGHERTMSNGVADSKSDTRSDDNWSSVNQPNQCQCGRSAPGGSNVQVGPELANTSHVNDTRETQHHENNDMEQGSSYGADANTSTNTRRSSTAGNENDDNSNSTTHPTYMNFSRPSNSDLRAEKPNNVNPVAANAQATGSNGTGQGRSEPTPPATTSVDFAAANQAAKQQQQQQQQQPKNNAIQSNATQNGPTSKPQKSKYVDAGSSTESPWQKTFGGGRAGGDPRTKVPNHIIGQQQPQSKNPFAAHMRNGSSNSNPSPNKFSNTNAIVNNLSNSSHSAVAQKNKPIPQPLPLGGGKKKENSTTSSSSSSHRAKVVTVDDKGGNNTVVPTPRSSKLSPDRQSDGHDNVKVVTINNGGGSLARNSPEGENNNSASPHQGVSSNGGGSGNPNGYDSTTDQGRTNSSQSDSMDFGGQSTYSNNKQSQRNGRQPDHPNNDNDYNKGYLDSAVDNVGSVMRDVGQKISGGNWNTAQTVGGR